jgi:octaheme c-type cytochrome (tetrathionate reductase family)
MNARKKTLHRWHTLTMVIALGVALAACTGDDGNDGEPGAPGVAGSPGAAGAAGVSCWDLNQNGIADPTTEDMNRDGTVDVNDCRTAAAPFEALHASYFTDHKYEGTSNCLDCHGPIGDDVMTTGHWNWQGVSANVVGEEAATHGKTDFVNNFCQAIGSNEGRCTQCHIGYGWKDKNFDFQNPRNIDCLVCHDQTGTYKKGQTTAGLPEPTVDLQLVARSVGRNLGVPPRKACLFCHTHAGGDDNVKHGDISSDLIATTREYDVHMGTDGANLECVDCHQVKKDAQGRTVSHGIGGMPYHSVDEGDLKTCTDCHGAAASIHAGTTVEAIVGTHPRIACQTCHIPAIARKVSTMVDWRWGDAGKDVSPVPVDPVTGRATYDKKKGTFVWKLNVRPELRFSDGRWNHAIVGVSDTFADQPVLLAAPAATYRDPAAMIYPYKKMTGNQPADAVNKVILVPHLFGTAGGPNPYWAKFNWDLALREGALYNGQDYSGQYEFVETEMLLSVNHEVAPANKAFGMGGDCTDCHGTKAIDWQALGWTDDPLVGTRP